MCGILDLVEEYVDALLASYTQDLIAKDLDEMEAQQEHKEEEEEAAATLHGSPDIHCWLPVPTNVDLVPHISHHWCWCCSNMDGTGKLLDTDVR
ncbi:hypothetical protein SK128_013648 [Halocaridina rubra]|uniref:Uncharacterized protein n=1 Tax=Halocaridina rubra TaxID=373956 RepID=A0AAN8X0Y8_HALRR